MLIRVVSLFADVTDEGARSVAGPFLATRLVLTEGSELIPKEPDVARSTLRQAAPL